ncbi:MAG: hypothetical protein KAZ26_24390 [Caldilineaceae bacterium]|nr:hypothetical protein [Caldilineaceae bacterium]
MSDDDTLAQLLEAKGYANCATCGRTLDRGDIAWNNYPHRKDWQNAEVLCICQFCDTEAFRIASSHPEIKNLDDVCVVIDYELGHIDGFPKPLRTRRHTAAGLRIAAEILRKHGIDPGGLNEEEGAGVTYSYSEVIGYSGEEVEG